MATTTQKRITREQRRAEALKWANFLYLLYKERKANPKGVLKTNQR